MPLFAQNNLLADLLFEARKSYKASVDFPYSIDLWNQESALSLYGKVDRKGRTVLLSENNLKQFEGHDGFAVDFVVDAFEDLVSAFNQARARRKVSSNSILAKLEPAIAWQSATSLYHDYMAQIYQNFVSTHILSLNKALNINGFDSFLSEFMAYAEQKKKVIFITKSGFINSNLCPNNVSGLFIDLIKGKHDNDAVKQQLMDDANFNKYLGFVKKYGFVVNRNNPFQLIFNPGSKQAQKYMKSYGVTYSPGSSSNLFELYYYKVSQEQDIEVLKEYLVQFYNSFAQAYPFYTCKGKTKQRSTVSSSIFDNADDNYSWFRLYCTLKIQEAEQNFTDIQVHNMLQKLSDLYFYVDKHHALDYLRLQLQNKL